VAKRIAIIGAGVSGLTCGVVLAEGGLDVAISSAERGAATTSAAAAAIWYPYDTGPKGDVMAWALATYRELADLSTDPRSGASMIELRCFSRLGQIEMPAWAGPLGGRELQASDEIPAPFTSGFALTVPLLDTPRYLPQLELRFVNAGGSITGNSTFDSIEEVNREFDLVVNCAGVGAKTLVPDPEIEPHRGQVAIMPKIDLPYAIVCDDAPLMYVIPRTGDCVFGGTNEIAESRARPGCNPAHGLRVQSHLENR